MPRVIPIILFLVVLAAPFVLRGLIHAPSEGKRSEDAISLVVLTPHAESIRREFGDAFGAWHREKFGQAIEMDYRALSANDIVRYLRAGKESVYQKLGTYNVDVVWGGGDYLHDVELKREDVMEGVVLPPNVMTAAYPKRELGGLALYDQSSPPTWFGTALSSFGIVYNKDVLKRLGLPEPLKWDDLKDPKYRGWIVLTDPTRSGVARSVFMVMIERAMEDAKLIGRSEDVGWAQGMGSIRQISSNARIFNDSGTAVAGWVSSGDVAAGLAIDFQARAQIEAVGEERLGYVEPAGATSVNPEPVGMVKGAPHPEVARRFIEFLLSERGQRLWITRAGTPGGPRSSSLRRLPIVPSVYANPVNFTETVNPFGAADSFNSSASRKKTLPVIPDLIEISCIDLLEELRETRAAILASADATVLDLSLGMFPLNQRQAIDLGQAWAKLSPLEKLEERRKLQQQFRQEYAQLRQAAEQKRATAHAQ